MSEFYNEEPDQLIDHNSILVNQANKLASALCINESEREIFLNGLNLEFNSSLNLYCRFPAKIEQNKLETKYKLLYDVPTVADLIDTFSESYGVNAYELSELYIGSSIAAFLLNNRIKAQNTKKIDRVLNMLTDPKDICTEITKTTIIPENKKVDAKMSLMMSDDTRIGNINVLRFSFGMYYLQSEENLTLKNIDKSKETRMQKLFREGLITALQSKPKYEQLATIFNRSDVAETVFADSVGEFEFAACFPMNWKQISIILRATA